MDNDLRQAAEMALKYFEDVYGLEDTEVEIKEKCDQILEAVVGPNAMDIWWNSPNQAFDMKPAKEMFLEDQQRVYRYLLNQVQR